MFNFTSISDEAKHTAAHILAAAVVKLYPKVKIGVGPVTKQGFYYEFEFSKKIQDKDLEKIEKEANKIRKEGHNMQQMFMSKDEALNMVLQRGQIYKAELLKSIPDQDISFYRLGDFMDLCRGPHIKNTGDLGPIKIIKIDQANWNDDPTRPLLQRIYGMTFSSDKELEEYYVMKQEEKERDYVTVLERNNLGRLVGDSLLLNESGSQLLNKLEKLINSHFLNNRFTEIYVNNVDNIEELFEHIDTAFQYKIRSPREFPITLKSRANVDDDFLNEKKQSHRIIAAKQYRSDLDLINLLPQITHILNFFKDLEIDLKGEIFCSKEDDPFIQALSNILQRDGISHTKVVSQFNSDIRIRFSGQDVLNRTWNIAELTIKVSQKMKNFRDPLNIVNTNINPFRIIVYMLENTKGNLPRILSPNEIVIIPVGKKNAEYALKVCQLIGNMGFIASTDLTSKSINKKVYLANKKNSTLQIIVGDKEQTTNSVSLRHLDKDLGLVSLEDINTTLSKIIET